MTVNTNIALKVASKFGKPQNISLQDFFKGNPKAATILRNVETKLAGMATNTNIPTANSGAMSAIPIAAAEGGSVPRQTTIEGQPHELSYINPGEKQLLLDLGGSGQPGPGGVPAYASGWINNGTSEKFVSESGESFSDLLSQNPGYVAGRLPPPATTTVPPVTTTVPPVTTTVPETSSTGSVTLYKDGATTTQPSDSVAVWESMGWSTTPPAATNNAVTTEASPELMGQLSGLASDNAVAGSQNLVAQEAEAEAYVSNITEDTQAAVDTSNEEVTDLNLTLSSLLDQQGTGENYNESLQLRIDATNEELKNATAKANDAQSVLSDAQNREIAKKSYTASSDPASLVTGVDVAGITDAPIDPATGLPKVETDAEKTARLAKLEVATGTGSVGPIAPTITAGTGTASTADPATTVGTSLAGTTKTKDDVDTALKGVDAAKGAVTKEVTGATGELSDGATPDANAMDPNYISEVTSGTRNVSGDELAKAQGLNEEAVKTQLAQADMPDNIKAAQTSVSPEEIPAAAQIADSEMAQAEAITADGLADDAIAVAKKMEAFNVDDGTLAEFKEGKIEAQDTVQGQLSNLMAQFDDGTPAWAAGAMRAANAAMAARGMGGSSMAAGAIIQAAMESALPIASADANAFREMKLDNLGRQQQISLTNAAAQQGVKLQNFNAEQTTMLQNSQNAFSLQTQNLSNMQSAVLANAQIKAALQGQNLSNQQQVNIAEAARYAEVNNLNLNNRQQAVLQDSANTLQVNLANLSTKQQAYTANAQLAAALQGKKIDNKQQTAILNAAKFSEANNLTFTAAQQAEIHNSELMKTVGLANLNAKQAATLQGAAAIASMDMANLSNEQQAAVENAKNFLQMDLANMSNEQQTVIFKAQATQQALLTDAAAENATSQFNASSKNQVDQFMASLKNQISQFNTTQTNTMEQFNVGEENAVSKYNSELKNQREQFNSSNALAIAQANAVWRQNIATLDTSAQNNANQIDAAEKNGLTAKSIDDIWQRERDVMAWAVASAESAQERAMRILLGDMDLDAAREGLAFQEAAAKSSWLSTLLFGSTSTGAFDTIVDKALG